MAASDVKLLGSWGSPFVLRARIALNLKSIDYEFLQEHFGSKTELLLKSNPVHKKMPVLLHGDKTVCESLVIVQYIDEVWTSGPSILPSDPYDRAIARFWAAYVDEKFFPTIRGISMAQGEEAKKAALEIVNAGLALIEEAFVKSSKGNDFFGGEKIGFLDIVFGSNLAWLKANEKLNNVQLIDEASTPNLFKWAEKFIADPSVKDVIPEIEKLAEFGKVLFAKLKAPQN